MTDRDKVITEQQATILHQTLRSTMSKILDSKLREQSRWYLSLDEKKRSDVDSLCRQQYTGKLDLEKEIAKERKRIRREAKEQRSMMNTGTSVGQPSPKREAESDDRTRKKRGRPRKTK